MKRRDGEPPQAGHRRGQGRRPPRSSCSSTRPTPWSARAAAQGDNDVRQSAQAGAGPRRVPDHRGHHLVRVQEVLREGPGVGATIPGRQGRRTGHRDRHRHAAWPARALREGARRHDARRRGRRGRRDGQPLHRRPAAPRQGRRPDGHGDRARPHLARGPAGRAAGPRRQDPDRGARARSPRPGSAQRRAGARRPHRRPRRGTHDARRRTKAARFRSRWRSTSRPRCWPGSTTPIARRTRSRARR